MVSIPRVSHQFTDLTSLKHDKIPRLVVSLSFFLFFSLAFALALSFTVVEQEPLVFHLFSRLSVKSDRLDLRKERYANYVGVSSVGLW